MLSNCCLCILHAPLQQLELQQPKSLYVPCRCVMDQAPRELSVQQLQLLPHFAEMVVRHLEKDRKALLQQAAAGRLLTRSIECVSEVQPRRLPQLAGNCVPMRAVHC